LCGTSKHNGHTEHSNIQARVARNVTLFPANINYGSISISSDGIKRTASYFNQNLKVFIRISAILLKVVSVSVINQH
jgi:hypothetical protein